MAKRRATNDSATLTAASATAVRSLFPESKNETWTTDRLSTGIVPLDWSLAGGFGFGRMSEVFGNYSSGKSHMVYRLLISALRAGHTCVLIETERAYDPAYFQFLGGNPADLVVLPAENVEAVWTKVHEIAEFAIEKKVQIVLCWDSIAATSTLHLQKVGMSKKDMTKAGSMSVGCEWVVNKVQEANICMLAVNQVRDKIDMYASGPQTTGGRAYPFYCSQRVEMKFDGGHGGSLIVDKGRDEPIGRWLKVGIEKSKLGPAWRKVKLPFYIYDDREHPEFGTATKYGIDEDEAMFDLYFEGAYRLPQTDPTKPPWAGAQVITQPTKGWYIVDGTVMTDPKNFRKADWPKLLVDNPRLRTLPLEDFNKPS